MSPTPQTPHGIKSPAKNRVMRSLAVAGVATAMLAGPVAAMAQNNLTIKATACYDVQAQVLNSLNTNNDGTTKDGDAAIKSQKNDYQKFLEDVVLADENTASTTDANAVAGNIQTELGTVADGAMVSINVVKVGDTYYYAAATVADPTDVATEDQSAATEISSDISEAVKNAVKGEDVTIAIGSEENVPAYKNGIKVGPVDIKDMVDIDYKNADKVGDATAVITAKKGTPLKGSVEATYTIQAKVFSGDVTLTVAPGTETRSYTGSEISAPSVSVKWTETNDPISTSDYEVVKNDASEKADYTNVGIKVFKVVGKGKYAGCDFGTVNVEVEAVDISKVSGLGEKSVSFKDAYQNLPDAFQLSFNGQELVAGEDFSVVPNLLDTAGKHTVTVTPLNSNFKGSTTVNVNVAQPSLADTEDANNFSVETTYNFHEQDLDQKVKDAIKDNSIQLQIPGKNGKDYPVKAEDVEVVAQKQTDAGTYKVTVKPTYASPWDGTKDIEVTIKRAKLNKMDPQLTSKDELVYNTKTQEPSAYELTVADGAERKTIDPSQYKVEHVDSTGSAAGTYKVRVTMLNASKNITGDSADVELSYAIDKLDLEDCTVEKLGPQPLDVVKADNLPSVVVKDAAGNVIPEDEYDVKLKDAQDLTSTSKPVEITITAKKDSNLTGATETSFMLQRMNIADAKVTVKPVTYRGTELSAAELHDQVKLTLGDTEVKDDEGTLFEVKFANAEGNVNAGDKKIVITPLTTDFSKGDIEATLTIKPFDLADLTNSFSYTGKLDQASVPFEFGENTPAVTDFKITNTEGLNLGHDGADNTVLTAEDYDLTIPTFDKAGNIEVVATGKGNFTGTTKLTFKINKFPLMFERQFDVDRDANATITADPAALVDGKAESVPTITCTDAKGNTHVLSGDVVLANFDLTYANNEAVGTATVTVTPKNEGSFGIVTGKDVMDGSVSTTFEVTPEVKEGVVTSYRLYNANNGDHFFTYSAAERDGLIEAGWKYEGVAWEAPASSSVSVYRFYDPNTGEHFYTANKAEAEQLKTTHWRFEGEQLKAPENGTTPIYRVKNPGANKFHHFTAGLAEYNMLKGLGWADEGIAWYV